MPESCRIALDELVNLFIAVMLDFYFFRLFLKDFFEHLAGFCDELLEVEFSRFDFELVIMRLRQLENELAGVEQVSYVK